MIGTCGYIQRDYGCDKLKSVIGDRTDGGFYKKVEYNNICIEWNVINKFYKDKCCEQVGEFVCVLDGVILNLQNLLCKYHCYKISDLMIIMYKANGEAFFNEFRGVFSGFFHDVAEDIVLIFTNHSGEKTIFYSIDNRGNVFWGSKVQLIKELFDQNAISYNLDIAAAYSLLTYAYMYDSLTLIEQVKRLHPGEYIRISPEKIDIKRYYHVDNAVTCKMSEKEIIEQIDKLFTNAVTMQLEKNKEYGYYDYVPLSAGLDSRMTTYCASRIKGEPLHNFTYSETEQLDYKISMQIARELRNHWGFKNLDNGLALYEIDASAKIGDGLIYYAWSSQLYDIFNYINVSKVGLIHTGVIGDVVIGTFNKTDKVQQYRIGDGAYSKKLIPKLENLINEKEYLNYETGMYYNRAFNGACLGYALPFGIVTEACSPFMDVDFMSFCLSIPLDYRLNHKIYYKWVGTYYPEAIKYPHNGVKIPLYIFPDISIRGKNVNLERVPSLISRKIQSKINPRNGMNPFDYWYHHNNKLKNIMDNYFVSNSTYLKDYPELKQDADMLYQTGTTIEKIQVISLIASVNMFFGKE